MSDEYVKTVVITDPAYRPGELHPAAPVEAPEGKAQSQPQDDSAKQDYPDFNDTSWLT